MANIEMLPEQPAVEEDWGEHALSAIAPGADGGNTVAPSEVVGSQKFQDMLKRDSPDVAWKVAFKTARRTRVGTDERLPAGFPQLWTFFYNSKSLRVFKWALAKYKELYPYDPEEHDHDPYRTWISEVSCLEEWHPQKLRGCLLSDMHTSTKFTNALSKKKLWFLINEGFFENMSAFQGTIAPQLRAKLNWRKVQWVVPVRRYALAWLLNHAQFQEEQRISKSKRGEVEDPLPKALIGLEDGRMSPSLKRARVE
jgi:hypothetical protein